jgi:hypothetical protein
MGMKTTVDIADPLFEQAKREAEASGTTLRELIELGLQKVLQQRAERKSKPYELPDMSVGEPGTLNPAIRSHDGRAMRRYCYMGYNGTPDTIEGINAELDAEDAADAAERAAAGAVAKGGARR